MRAVVIALCLILSWLYVAPAEAAPRRGRARSAEQEKALKERRKKARKKRRAEERAREAREGQEAASAPEAESEIPAAELEPGDELPMQPAAAPTPVAPAPADAERETIDLGPDSEKETIDLGDSSSPESIDLGDSSAPESIDLGDSSAPESIDLGSTPSSSAPVDEEQLDFQLRGWARTRVSQAVYAYPLSADGLGVPQEPRLGEQQLFAEVRYQRNRWFEATASGLFTYTLARHEQQDGPTSVEVTKRGLFEPSLRELFVGLYSTHLSGRVGQQRVAWGNSDAFTINDVVNPYDLREPVLAETEVLHVPSPLVRADVTGKWGALQLLFAPFFRPNLFDVYGTNWALVQPDAPRALRGALGTLSNLTDPSLREPTQLLVRQTSLPPDDFSAPSGGARLDWSALGINVSHYYFYGYTSAPALRIDPALLGNLAMIDWTMATPNDLASLLGAVNAGALTSTYERTHHAGTSVTTSLGSFVLRAEGAYDSTRVLTSRNLLAVLRPAAQAVAGIEYQPDDDGGKLILLEGSYTRLLGDEPGLLLGARQTSYGAAGVVRWTFFDHLELELRAVASIAPRGAVLRPQLAYKKSFWELRGGYVWIDGQDGSQQHYYRRNQNGYVIAKLKF